MSGNKPIQDRIGQLVDALSQGLYERKEVVRLCLLAALAGESVFMLGPPGIGKSLIARRLICAFQGSRSFEYLMTRFSTPDEVFGPLSIQALKDEGQYLRLTEGYLPEAEVVFLDEIWKAGPAILNTLLTVINEHRFRNGTAEMRIPMRLLVTASNELPQEESGLEALFDRMLFRVWLDRIQDKQNFHAMLISRQDPHQDPVPAELKITDDEYAHWQQELSRIALPDTVFDRLFRLREKLERLEDHAKQGQSLYVSDRRWKKALHLLQASAFFNGRQQVSQLDLLLLKDCLWHDLASREQIESLLHDFARRHSFDQERIRSALQRLGTDLERFLGEQLKELGCRLASQSQRFWRKNPGWQLDFKGNGLDPRQPSYRLLFLEPCQLDPKQPERRIQGVEIDCRQLRQWLRKGGTVRVRLEQGHQTINLSLDVDKDHYLIARDPANRPLPLFPLRTDGIPVWLPERWFQRLDDMAQTLKQQQLLLEQRRSTFARECPHLFLGQEWVREVDSSLMELAEQVASLRQQLSTRRQDLAQLLETAGGGRRA